LRESEQRRLGAPPFLSLFVTTPFGVEFRSYRLSNALFQQFLLSRCAQRFCGASVTAANSRAGAEFAEQARDDAAY